MTGISKEGMALVTCDLEALMRHQANGFDVSKTLPGSQQRNSLHLTLSSTTAAVDPDFVRYLIDQGVDVGAQDRYGYTPLHYAARGRRPEIIQILIDAGASVDVEDNDRGYAPILHAIDRTDPCPECMEILVRAGSALHSARYRNWLRTAHTIPGHEFMAALVAKYVSIDPELEPVEPG